MICPSSAFQTTHDALAALIARKVQSWLTFENWFSSAVSSYSSSKWAKNGLKQFSQFKKWPFPIHYIQLLVWWCILGAQICFFHLLMASPLNHGTVKLVELLPHNTSDWGWILISGDVEFASLSLLLCRLPPGTSVSTNTLKTYRLNGRFWRQSGVADKMGLV